MQTLQPVRRSEKEKEALYRELSSPFRSSALIVESARRLGSGHSTRSFLIQHETLSILELEVS